MSPLSEIDERSREVFRQIVETYIETGEPVGSRTLSQGQKLAVSAATIRNVMADLTDAGLLYSPHISSGRLPTENGLRLFVDSMMQVGDLSDDDRGAIEASGVQSENVLEDIAARLSGLTQSASLVLAEKREQALRDIEFVATSPGEALCVLMFEDGQVENRIVKTPVGMPNSSLEMARNFLSVKLRGKTISEARDSILKDVSKSKNTLDELTAKLVEAGVADFAGGDSESLIVRGRGRLLDEATDADLERVGLLFDDLERKRDVVELLSAAKEGEGVKVFIGSENRLFSLSGSSLIIAPYRDAKRNVVGVLGVIGPTRLNYARVVPMVDYTAEVVSRLMK